MSQPVTSRSVTTPEHLKAEAEMLARLNSRFEETLGDKSLEEIFDLDRNGTITAEEIEAIEREYGL